MTIVARRKVLITGAAGGMGRACAQLFGATHDLVLTDVVQEKLDAFADELRAGGHIVSAYAGDMMDDAHLQKLAGELGGGSPFSVIHTAGLSPALADWKAIMQVNLVASEKLMNALDPVLVSGCVVVPIASMAGHMMPVIPEVDALLQKPLDSGYVDAIGKAIEGMSSGNNSVMDQGGVSYSLSKRGIHLLTERKAIEWGPRGVRVISISPGVIHTPMGLMEKENTPGALELIEAAPIGRIGTPMDVATCARFLCSEDASYITGSDVKVDGGSTCVIMGPGAD